MGLQADYSTADLDWSQLGGSALGYRLTGYGPRIQDSFMSIWHVSFGVQSEVAASTWHMNLSCSHWTTERKKTNCTRTFQASDYITFTNIALNQTSHIVGPNKSYFQLKSKEIGKYTV